MATNLDNRALNSIGANVDPNQYKAAFDGLKQSIEGLQQPLQTINDTLTTIGKTMADSGKKTDGFTKMIDDFSSSVDTWTKVVDIVKAVGKTFSDGTAEASDGMAALIPLIIASTLTIGKWAAEMLKGETTVTALGKRLRETKMVMDTVAQANLKGAQNAQSEIVNLQALYNATQDQNVAYADRYKIAQKLQQDYPDQLGHMSTEAILAGQAAKNYDELTKSIMAASKAKAAEEIMVKNNIRAIGNDDQRQKLMDDLKKANRATAEIKKVHDEVSKGHRGLSGAASDAGDVLQDKVEAAQKQADEILTKIRHIDSDTELLHKKNKALSNIVSTGAEQNGATALGVKTPVTPNAPSNPPPDNSKFKEANNQAEDIMKASNLRQLQITAQGYSAELLQQDENYKQQLDSLDKLLSQKTIKQAEYNKVKQQLDAEHQAAVKSTVEKFNTEVADKAQQAQNELVNLQIKGMEDGSAKQIAELNQQQQERNQQYAKVKAENSAHLSEIEAEIAKAKAADPNADLSGLQNLLVKQMQIIALNNEKRVEDEQQTEDAIKKIKDKAAADDEKKAKEAAAKSAQRANKKLLKTDQDDIDNAGPDDKEAAEKKLVQDKYKFQIDQAKQANRDTAELEDQLQDDLDAIDAKHAKDKKDKAKKLSEEIADFERQTAQKAADAAFTIVKNSISAQANAKVKQLETDKSAELANTSLTSAQRQAIQQDYQKKEAAVKVKAFKDEQLASLGQALINGALAITKVTAQMGMTAPLAIPAIIAETAIQVATIAAQKPPAYAKGGVHYHSDGRGGVLAGYSRTDNTNAYLRSGEGIVVSEAMRVPWARNLVSAINVGFGGRDFSISNPTKGFAVGGIFTDGGDANRYYNQPVNDQKNLSNTIAYQMINNFPPVYVDVKDINNQQNILAQTINRVNL